MTQLTGFIIVGLGGVGIGVVLEYVGHAIHYGDHHDNHPKGH